MFIEELIPIFKELTQQPIAFVGGFCSGVLNLNLTDDPLKSWLVQQQNFKSDTDNKNSPNQGPQSISIE